MIRTQDSTGCYNDGACMCPKCQGLRSGVISFPYLVVDDEKDRKIEEYFAAKTKKERVRAAQKIVDTWGDGNREADTLREIIKRVRKIHPPKFTHHCNEWDGLMIDEYDPEFSACTCFR